MTKSLIFFIDNIDLIKNRNAQNILNLLDVTDNEINKWILFLYDIEKTINNIGECGIDDNNQIDYLQTEEENNYSENLIDEIYKSINSIINENINNNVEFAD